MVLPYMGWPAFIFAQPLNLILVYIIVFPVVPDIEGVAKPGSI